MIAELLESNWHIHHGDCITHMSDLPGECFDMSVFSPPFPSVYAYTNMAEDIGNSEDLKGEARLHLSFFYRQLARVVKPGRAIVVHVTQIPRMKRSGDVGLFDFRGLNIRLAERAGLVFEFDWGVRKNPQSQAIRTRSRELQFAGLESDRAKSRGCLSDYLLKFRVRGDNAVRVDAENEVSRNDWIKWAEPFWGDIIETDTLNVAAGRGEDDTKHICLAVGSLVLTREHGYLEIEEVEAGDHVLTHEGRWQPVIAKRCNGISDTIRVCGQGVADLRCTHDHKLWTRRAMGSRPKEFAKGSDPVWVQAKDTLGSYLNLKLPPIEESELTPDEWWIVGRWLGDGHRGTRRTNGKHGGGLGQFIISCNHNEVGDLRARLGVHAGSQTIRTATQINLVGLRQCVRDVLDSCGSGAANKRLPGDAVTLNKEKSESLLSGYLSADGCYIERYDRVAASSVSRGLLLGMAMVAQRARGVVASVYAGRPNREGEIEGRRVSMLQDWAFSFRDSDGYKKSGWIDELGAWKKVRKMEDAGESEVWDLQVAEDSSFTAEGCVVHNCPLQLEVIRRLVLLYSNPGEVVFSPFAGIGSEGYVALGGKSPKTGKRILNPRQFYGCEIKKEYLDAATRNLESAEKSVSQDVEKSLF